MTYPLVGILGGTFDPIHYGHLAVANYISTHYPLQELHFIPCLQPPHRPSPQAAPEHRLAMIKLAISEQPNWIVNDIDLQRSPPSYMVDTLTLLRQQQPLASFCLILGMDAYAKFNQWHQWQQILTLSHIIVINRPEFNLPGDLWSQQLLAKAEVKSAAYFQHHLSGGILLQTIPPSPISATIIRENLSTIENTLWLPPVVLEYIRKHRLYGSK